MELQPHQQRVVDERHELNERLNKLLAFTSTVAFAKLPQAERELMTEQAHYMQAYSNVLAQRLHLWGALGVGATMAADQLPAAVIEWRDAYAEYLAASDAYNTRLAAIRKREAMFPSEFGRDNPEAEWHALTDAQSKQFRLIRPMYEALATLGVEGRKP